jgi:hypothetical protein
MNPRPRVSQPRKLIARWERNVSRRRPLKRLYRMVGHPYRGPATGCSMDSILRVARDPPGTPSSAFQITTQPRSRVWTGQRPPPSRYAQGSSGRFRHQTQCVFPRIRRRRRIPSLLHRAAPTECIIKYCDSRLIARCGSHLSRCEQCTTCQQPGCQEALFGMRLLSSAQS